MNDNSNNSSLLMSIQRIRAKVDAEIIRSREVPRALTTLHKQMEGVADEAQAYVDHVEAVHAHLKALVPAMDALKQMQAVMLASEGRTFEDVERLIGQCYMENMVVFGEILEQWRDNEWRDRG